MALPRRPATAPRRVVCNPSILGDEPTLEGTRVPVRSVVQAMRFGDGLDDVLQAYPMLDRGSIEAALAYYARNRDEIDWYIAENDDPAE